MLDWFNLLASGVTIGTAGPAIHGYISGFTLARKVKEDAEHFRTQIEDLQGRVLSIDGKLEALNDNVFLSDHDALRFFGHRGKGTSVPLTHLEHLRNGQKIISDKAVEPPEGLIDRFTANPENYLFSIQPLNAQEIDASLLNDPSLVPWCFQKFGVDFIGFAKKGYVEALGISFTPLPRKSAAAAARPARAARRRADDGKGATPARGTPAEKTGRFARLKEFTDSSSRHVNGEEGGLWQATVDGNIFGERIVIGEKQTVRGMVFGREVLVRGYVVGDVFGEKVRLPSGARLEGNIYHRTIAIESGVHFDGSVQRVSNILDHAPKREIGGKTKTIRGYPTLTEVDGDVSGSLVNIPEGTTVRGHIVAIDAVIKGRVIGGVFAEKLRLTKTARIEGDMHHKTIAIETGAHFEGSIKRHDDPIAVAGAEWRRKLERRP